MASTVDQGVLPVSSTQPASSQGERAIISMGYPRGEFSFQSTCGPRANMKDPDFNQVVGRAHDLGTYRHVPVCPLRPSIHQPVSGVTRHVCLHLTARSITSKDLLTMRPNFAALPVPTISALGSTLTCFFAGNVLWTILEYTFHRFLFHIDHLLPDANWALMLHFLLHGIHHYLPMDRLRLVMPPTLFFFLETPFTKLAHVVFPASIANGVISGAFAFYILYDCMHYALHHSKLPQYMAEMKRYHLAHHYKSELCARPSEWQYTDAQTLSLVSVSRAKCGITSSTLSSPSQQSSTLR